MKMRNFLEYYQQETLLHDIVRAIETHNLNPEFVLSYITEHIMETLDNPDDKMKLAAIEAQICEAGGMLAGALGKVGSNFKNMWSGIKGSYQQAQLDQITKAFQQFNQTMQSAGLGKLMTKPLQDIGSIVQKHIAEKSGLGQPGQPQAGPQAGQPGQPLTPEQLAAQQKTN